MTGTCVLAARLLRVSSLYRRQVVTLTVSVLLPLAGNLASSIGLPFAKAYDPTPIFVSIGGLVLVWGAFRYRLLDLLPVARTMTFDRLDDPVLVVDPFGRIVDRNPAAVRLLGSGATIGTPVQHVLQRQAAVLDATASGAEIRVVDRQGETREFELVTSDLPGPRGGSAGQLVHLREITARKRAELRLRWLADYDPLTGLPNRRLLSDRLDQAIARARRAGGRCALLLVDLDRFKLINDSLGHPTGDAVLAEVAQRLRAGRRDEDTAARLGGDEFAVLLPEVTNTDDAAIVARRVLAGLSAPIHLQDREFIVTASVGVAVWPDDGTEPLELFGRADAAMYKAKAHGRNRVESGPSDGSDDAAQRLELGVDLWHALRRSGSQTGELHLLYQPIVDLRTDRVIALEALIRWHHPKLGLLTPASFLPVAQEAGLSHDLDRWVLGQACAQAAAWRADGYPTPVTVNVSAERFRDDPHSLGPDVTAALARSGLPAHLLVLEINERTVIHEPEPVAEELRALRDLGVGLALDDFGAGHTSLTHLRQLPIGLLKIDQSLVRGIAGDGDDRRILAAVVTLAGILGMRIIAEGVERTAQLEALRSAGCDAGQGVHLQPPLDPLAAGALLAGTDLSGRAVAR
jgi:diguanylate cyclase (GGDEF)-like protein